MTMYKKYCEVSNLYETHTSFKQTNNLLIDISAFSEG